MTLTFNEEVFNLVVINLISQAPCPKPSVNIRILATTTSIFEYENSDIHMMKIDAIILLL